MDHIEERILIHLIAIIKKMNLCLFIYLYCFDRRMILRSSIRAIQIDDLAGEKKRGRRARWPPALVRSIS